MTDLKVTQADRDAAKSLLGRDDAGPSWWAIDSGNADNDSMVQAFARHRIAAEEGKAELVEAVQRWVDATDAIAEFERDHPNDTTSRWDRLFDERGFASDALRATLARVRGELT